MNPITRERVLELAAKHRDLIVRVDDDTIVAFAAELLAEALAPVATVRLDPRCAWPFPEAGHRAGEGGPA